MSLRPKKPHSVIIDGRAVGPISNGVGRSIRLLAKGLAEQPKLSYSVAFLCRPGFSNAFSGFETIEMKTPFLDPREALSIPAVLWRRGTSLYHSPTHSSLVAAPCPHIVTLHDLIPLRWGSPLEQIYFQGIVASFAARAKVIVTVSEAAKRDILGWFQTHKNPTLLRARTRLPAIEVVPNAIDPYLIRGDGEGDESLSKWGLERGRYFLCLTNDRLHKNASLAVRAFQMAREQLDLMGTWKLVVTTDQFKSEPGVVATGNLNEAETLSLLRSAKALVFPSLEEGFGLPPLEAGVVGVPVIVSDIPVHREVLGIAGSGEVNFIDPQHPVLWVRALLDAAQGNLKPWNFSTRQKAMARYSVESLGRNMDALYSRVLSQKA